MDCGPAALKALLAGFRIPVSYGRLREACQTSLDGSCIDTVEIVAAQVGLNAEQVMLPVDHLLLPEAGTLPAVVVVQLPAGVTHFVVVWRRHGNFVQVMDPGVGRRWLTSGEFLRQVYRHSMPVPADGWREFAASTAFALPLQRRLMACGVSADASRRLYALAGKDPEWHSLAALDAATRLIRALIDAGALKPGKSAASTLQQFVDNPEAIPDEYWSAQKAAPDEDANPQVLFRGAVLVRVSGVTRRERDTALSEDVGLAVAERTASPAASILAELRASGTRTVLALLAGGLLSAAAVLLEALLFRNLFDVSGELRLGAQRMGAVVATAVFLAALFLFDLSLFAGCARLGRQLENRFRSKFLRKIPVLGDAYFQSRLMSDMAERSHAIHRIRNLPDLARQVTRYRH